MGCVQPFAVNPLNFLRWHACADATLPMAAPLEYCLPARTLCAPLLFPDDGNPYESLPAVGGDQFRFFINSDSSIDITRGFASVALGLVRNGKLIAPSAGDLFSLPGGRPSSYFLYGVLKFDCIPDGVYWPVIYDVDDKHILLVANSVQVCNYQNWQRDTCLVRYRHPSSLYGVNYSALPGLYQEFRLALSMYQSSITTDEAVYTDRNGRKRTTDLNVGRVLILQTDFWAEADYEAAALMLTHREVFINDKLVKADGGLDPDYSSKPFVTAKGKVIDQNFARKVLVC